MIPTLENMDFTGKKVFVRVDYNVPQRENGEIADDTRIRASIPTIKKILEGKPKQIILATHLGRPDGKRVMKYSTQPMALRLAQLLGSTVQHADDCINLELPDTTIVLLENLRFYAEEEANDPTFAKKLSEFADIYVNDAFGTAHRAHASTEGITKYLPGCIGLLIQKELVAFDFAQMQAPIHIILGGVKLETKLPIIQRAIGKVDKMLIGGAMMFTFYKAKGYEVGNSLVDTKFITMAKILLNNDKIIIPTDVVVAANGDDGEHARTVIDKGIPAGSMGLDIGEASIELFKKELSDAKTIVWNGPLGMMEKKPFDKATIAIAHHLAQLTAHGVHTIVGGGDSVEAVENLGLASKFTHVSTGGGASMTLLEGKQLVALSALDK